VEDFATIGTLDLKKSYHHSGLSSMMPNYLWKEEGISIASEVVKVEGEDPDTPGYLKGGRVRRNVGDLKSWVHPPWLARDETPGP